MSVRLLLTALLMSCVCLGCQTDLYEWGNYDQKLYKYYKDAEKRDDLKVELEAVFAGARDENAKVAPGLYAEYGYLLLEEGEPDEAATYFEMEKQAWPESAAFMERMIGVCNGEAEAGLSETSANTDDMEKGKT